MSTTWLLLMLAIALIAFGALRFDLLVARWRELAGQPPAGRAPPAPLGAHTLPQGRGARAHPDVVHKPGFHRSGRRQ